MTPKGNFMAYQPLKPTEYKVGDIYSNMIDGMIKRGEAKKAAEFKRKTENAKNHADLMKDWKVDYKTTITPFQDATNDSVLFAKDKIWEAQQVAQDLNSTEEQKTFAEQVARNAMDDALQEQTFFADPKLLESYEKNLQLIAQNKAFKGDPRISMYQSSENGSWMKRKNPDGTTEFAFINPNDPKDKTLEFKPISEIKALWGTPIEEDKSDEWNTNIIAQAKDAANEIGTDYYDKRGNLISESKKTFDPKRAKDLISLQLGFDEKRPIEEQININAIPPKLNHWYYKYTNGEKTIQTKQDFMDAIDASVKEMQAATDPKTVTSIKKTAAELAGENLSNQEKKKRIQKMDREAAESQPQAIQPTISNATFQIKDKTGTIVGTQDYNFKQFVFPKKSNFPQSKFTFGIANVENDKDGKSTRTVLGIGNYSQAGDNVFSGTSASNIINEGLKAGYSVEETKQLLQGGNIPINKYNPKMRIVGKNKYGKIVNTPKGDVIIVPSAQAYKKKKLKK